MRIYNLKQINFSCPSDWEANADDGAHIYIRYRWGYLSVDSNNNRIFGLQYGDGWNGTMNTPTMLRLTGFQLIH